MSELTRHVMFWRGDRSLSGTSGAFPLPVSCAATNLTWPLQPVIAYRRGSWAWVVCCRCDLLFSCPNWDHDLRESTKLVVLHRWLQHG